MMPFSRSSYLGQPRVIKRSRRRFPEGQRHQAWNTGVQSDSDKPLKIKIRSLSRISPVNNNKINAWSIRTSSTKEDHQILSPKAEEEDKKKKKKKKRRYPFGGYCWFCPFWCCLFSLLGALLLGAVIAALLVALLTLSKTSSTTTVITTTTKTTSTPATTVTLYIPSNYYTACAATCTNVTIANSSTLLAAWPFENNPSDLLNTYNGIINDGATFVSGYVNQALSLNGATQYMKVISPFISLVNRSFTFEAWIKLSTISSAYDTGIFGQNYITMTDQCLYILIRSNKLYFGFFNDDVSGLTIISTNTWIHVACVYDLDTNTKSIYLNGVLDASITTGSYYKGIGGYTYVGYATTNVVTSAVNGYIDQVSLSNRAKTACEIFNDATLVAHFSFDNVITDSGPNSLQSYTNPQANSGVSYVASRVNQALMFSATSAFVQICNLYSLGLTNQPYSFALWINPNVTTGTLIHLSSDRAGVGSWCMAILGFVSNGTLVAQSWKGPVVTLTGPLIPTNNWTHIVQTWSSTNGLRLYVNGGLYASTPMPSFTAIGVSMYILLGSSGFGTNCQTSGIAMGSYSGAIDEFYIYNREITQAEICPLAHP